VIRTPVGGGIRGGHYHSQSPEALFIHTAGLKVVAPSNPYDAKGLLLAAMRQNDPVLFMEPKRIYRASKADVPDGEYALELGKARTVRDGSQVTVIAWSGMVSIAEDAARLAAEAQISAEVIDLRTLMPFDIDALIASVRKTGRVVIVHEAPRTCGFGAELIASIQERAMEYLEAPIVRVTGFDTPFPYSLEHEYLPNPDRVMAAIRQTLEW
jgi:2-oxoisovalerate dehydrogenase E1 component beta subunit